ncbi:MAG: hypothetical protein ACXITV_09935 [Luteibaculaceae bacterium]
MHITFQYPIWFVVLAPFVSFAITWFFYRKNKTLLDFSKAIYYTAFTLRFLGLTLLFFLLAEPLLKSTINYTEKPTLIVALDNSLSVVSTADSTAVREKLGVQLPSILAQKEKDIAIEWYYFDSDLSTDLTFAGAETNISQVFTSIKNSYANRSNITVALATDGLFNRGLNPLYQPEANLFPVFTLGLGDTATYPDIKIANLRYNKLVYKGNEFPIEVQVGLDNTILSSAQVKLFASDKQIAEKTLEVSNSSFVKTTFMVEANTAGLTAYRVVVSSFPNEKNTKNNEEKFFVEVIENRQKILVVSAEPHPDVFALVSALTSVESFEVIQRNETTVKEEDLKGIDLLVTVGLPSLGRPGLRTLLAKSDAPTFSILGMQTDLQAYQRIQNGVIFPERSFQKENFFTVANANFVLFNLGESTRKLLNTAPPLQFYIGKVTVSGNLEPIGFQRIGNITTQNPNILIGEVDGRKQAVILGEGLWRWRMQAIRKDKNPKAFDKLIEQIATYLAIKQDRNRLRVLHSKSVRPSQPILFEAEVYNKSFEPFTNGTVEITFTTPDGLPIKGVFSAQGEGRYVLNNQFTEDGIYTYKVTVDEFPELSYSGTFIVESFNLELTNLTANHSVLKQLSEQTNANFYHFNEFDEWINKALNSEMLKPNIFARVLRTSALNMYWLLAVILLIFGSEWLLRKYAGTY